MHDERSWSQKLLLGGAMMLAVLLTAPLATCEPQINDLGYLRPDHSYQMAQVELLRQHAQYGRDVVWTYGPLGVLSNTIWNPPEFFVPVLLARAAIAVIFVLSWWHVLCRSSLSRVGRTFLALAVIVVSSIFLASLTQAFWMSFPMLAIALRVQDEHDDRPWLLCLLALASALAGLVKFPYLIWGSVVFGLMSLGDILQRRRPIPGLAFASAFLVGWVACGQNPSNLPDYFERHLSMTSGYAAAMAKGFIEPYRVRDVGYMLLAALLPAAGYALTFPKADRRTWFSTAVGWATLALMCEKYAFGGNQIESAARCLGMMSLVCLAIVSRRQLTPRRYAVVCTFYVAGLVAVIGVMARYDDCFRELRRAPWRMPLACLRNQSVAAYQLAFGTGFQTNSAAYERTQNRIVELAGIPAHITGTADLLGSNPGVVTAHKKLHYSPRPMMESINAQTGRLAEEDAAFFRGEHAPQHVLFEVAWYPVTPFDRLPAINDGPSWFELLSRYRLSHVGRELLIFSQRPAPRPLEKSPLAARRIRWNEEVVLPEYSDSLLWAQIEVSDTAIGKLAELLYKRPRILVTVRTSIGRTQEYSLVPQMAAAGFLLSPHVAAMPDMALVAASVACGQGVDALERVESILLRVEGDRGGFFGEEISLKLARVRLNGPYPSDACPEIDQLLTLNRLRAARESSGSPMLIESSLDTGHFLLTAGAPSRTGLQIPAGSERASISFGLRKNPGNSRADKTTGVEFRITAVRKSGQRKRIASKVVDSAKIATDRDEFRFEFPIDGDATFLILETLAASDCSVACDAYWSNPRFD